MYFTTISKDAFSSNFIVERDSFIEQISQIILSYSYQDEFKDKFIGEITDNILTCKKSFVDNLGSRIMVEVRAELIRKDANLLIETSLKPRRFKFSELNEYAKFMMIFILGATVLISCIFIFLAITKSDNRHLLTLISLPIGLILGYFQLSASKENALKSVTEDLKKEFELAYLRANNS